MTTFRHATRLLPALILAPALALAQLEEEEAPELENCLQATNPTVDFGSVAIGEKGKAHLFIYNFCDHPVPLKYIYIKPPFALESGALPDAVPATGFTALALSFQPVIPSPAMAKLILVGDKHTRVVLNARLHGEVVRPAAVTLEERKEILPGDSTRAEGTEDLGG